MKSLRGWTLLLLLGLAPGAEAAASLFHLCHGRLQLDLTCCCKHDEPPPPAHVHDVASTPSEPGCCGEVTVVKGAHPPAAPTSRSGSPALLQALAILVAWEVDPPPPPSRLSCPALNRTGAHVQTAPLLSQGCSLVV